MSRVQNDRPRLRNYFLKGYSLVLAMTIPMTIMCGFFANDLIQVLLGPKWAATAPIFPAAGADDPDLRHDQSAGMADVRAGDGGTEPEGCDGTGAVVMCGYLAGLHYGPKGVAFGYSAIMILWVIPHIAWCVHGTGVSLRDILVTVSKPLLSGLVGAAVAFAVHRLCIPLMPALPRVVIAGVVLLIVYVGMLFYVMGQKALYMDVIKGFRKRAPVEDKALAPA